MKSAKMQFNKHFNLNDPSMFIRIVQYISILLCIFGVNCDDLELTIPQGKLRGGTRTNRDGKNYYSFQNIPYAEPPVGKLRFKAPKPASGWSGIRNATEDVPQCVQVPLGTTQIAGQEDCLYLNVYIPELPAKNITKKAVMVFLYGGSFTRGSASETTYGAEFLLTEKIVLVIFNYRVGIFGFLSLDDPDLGVPGNAGMKDQVLALQWVKDNIAHFGGDPDKILIFGQSAGGGSVHLHMLSSMSKGLFNKAIIQSGTALTPGNKVRNNGELIAKQLGIQSDNWREMLASLRNTSAASLSEAETALLRIYRNLIGPIVEIPSEEPAFIKEDSLDTIRSGKYNHVPFITGFTDAEGLLLQRASRLATGQNVLITNFSTFIPPDLKIEGEEREILSLRIKRFYYGETEPNRDNITGAVSLGRDYVFAFPAYRSVKEHFKTTSCHIYVYFFAADTRLNVYKMLDETTAVYPGAAHGDDVGYLFRTFLTPQIVEGGSVEDVDSRRMVELWTNFAIYGNPTPKYFRDFKWKPVKKNAFNYLHITTETFSMDTNPIPENLKFWSDVYKKYFTRN